MGIATIIMVYVIIWWLVFFTLLPVGIRSQHETEEGVTKGTEPGAPSNPNLGKKLLITSLAAVVLTIGFYFLQASDLITFRTMRP